MGTSGTGRVVVVTGANGGIASHLAAALVEDGYRVAGLDVEDERIAALGDSHPERVRFHECDVTSEEDVNRAIDAVVDEWGRIDVLVNMAAVATVGPFEERSIADDRREVEVNYFGYLRTTRAVLPYMREQGGGIVHNVSSGSAIGGQPRLSGYAATKGAIESFTRSLRLELRDENVSCTLMHPPMTETRLTAHLGLPERLLNDPAEVGRKLANRVESTDRVVYADWQTRAGLGLIRWVPLLWEWGLDRFVGTDG